MGLLGIRSHFHHGSAASSSVHLGTALGTGDCAVLERAVEHVAVDEVVHIVLLRKHGLVLRRAVLNCVQRGAVARNVHDGLSVGHGMVQRRTGCAVRRVVVRVVVHLLAFRHGHD